MQELRFVGLGLGFMEQSVGFNLSSLYRLGCNSSGSWAYGFRFRGLD